MFAEHSKVKTSPVGLEIDALRSQNSLESVVNNLLMEVG